MECGIVGLPAAGKTTLADEPTFAREGSEILCRQQGVGLEEVDESICHFLLGPLPLRGMLKSRLARDA